MSNPSNSISNQISSKLEKANLELTKMHIEMSELENTCLRLERAHAALNDELVLPIKKVRNINPNNPGIDAIYKFVCSNPGLNGASIQRGLNTTDNSIYHNLTSLVKQNKLYKDINKLYYPVSIPSEKIDSINTSIPNIESYSE